MNILVFTQRFPTETNCIEHDGVMHIRDSLIFLNESLLPLFFLTGIIVINHIV